MNCPTCLMPMVKGYNDQLLNIELQTTFTIGACDHVVINVNSKELDFYYCRRCHVIAASLSEVYPTCDNCTEDCQEKNNIRDGIPLNEVFEATKREGHICICESCAKLIPLETELYFDDNPAEGTVCEIDGCPNMADLTLNYDDPQLFDLDQITSEVNAMFGVDDDAEPCDRCEKSGMVNHQECEGKGCYECRNTGLVSCPDCGGKGYINPDDDDPPYRARIRNITNDQWILSEHYGKVEYTEHEKYAVVFYDEEEANATLDMLNDTLPDCFTLFEL